jgi:hypothetical protein
MDLDVDEIIQMGPAVALGTLFTTIDVHYPDCSGAGCPCSEVVGCMQQVRSDLQKLLHKRQCYTVFHRILANMADRMVLGGHSAEAAVACAEQHYR